MNTQQYKKLKGLKKQNLRDNMSTTELILNMLAETSTTDISKEEKPTTFEENQRVARRGGRVGELQGRLWKQKQESLLSLPKTPWIFQSSLMRL